MTCDCGHILLLLFSYMYRPPDETWKLSIFIFFNQVIFCRFLKRTISMSPLYMFKLMDKKLIRLLRKKVTYHSDLGR